MDSALWPNFSVLNSLTLGFVKLLNNGILKIDKGDYFLTFKIFNIDTFRSSQGTNNCLMCYKCFNYLKINSY